MDWCWLSQSRTRESSRLVDWEYSRSCFH